MMRTSSFGPLLMGGVAAALAVFIAQPLSAQEAVVTGRVMGEGGVPLGGANVLVANTNFGAVTTSDGSYSITFAPQAVRGQQIVITARFIGYRPVSRTITLTPGRQELNFVLVADPLLLEELVVTGVGEATAAKKLTFSVGRVSEEQLQEVPGTSALVAIQGKVAGARLIPTSSQPGGEVSVRLRGATSIGGRQDPLFIVDGVITPFGLADMAAEDVERVEIVKGAAASSLYGSNAANGVVQIFTRRGSSLPEGELRVTARFEAGINNMPRRMEFSRSHAFEINETANYCASQDRDNDGVPDGWTVAPNGNYCLSGGARVVKESQIADNPFPVYFDHWDAMVETGAYWTAYGSVGQRRGGTNFNASFQNTRNEGVIFGLGGYTRQNFRLNLDQQLHPNLDASFSAFYGTSTNGRTEEAQGGPFFGLMFLQPDVDVTAPCEDGTPYCPIVPLSGDVANDFNPMYELANRKINQDRNRFTGSGRLRWRPLTWLSAEGSFAYDQESMTFSDFTPFGFQTSTGTKEDGDLVQSSANNYQYNGGVSLTSVRTFGAVTNTTRIAALWENQKNRLLEDTARILRVADVPHFGVANQSSLVAGSLEETIRNQNYYALTTFDIKDRYILDGLVRRDGSSLFGPESRWATYYRVSGAWRVNEDLRIGGLDEWRLRASYGTAGLRPSFADQYEILVASSSGFTPQILGNPLLKPARSGELELGTNIEFGEGRYSLEYSYARKETTDQILLVDLPAAAEDGFKQQWRNTGAVESNTHELSFGARLINSPSTSLQLNVVGDRTRQRITEWNLPERLYQFQQMPAAFFLGEGSDLGAIHGNRWVRNVEELYDDPEKAALSDPGEAWHEDNLMINEDGYVVRKDAYGTTSELPIKYTYCKRDDGAGTCLETSQLVQIGNANPDFNLSFGLTFNHKRFGVNALLDWSYGGDLYNGTRQWAFQATRDRAQDQGGKPDNAQACGLPQANPVVGSCPKKPFPYYAVGFYNGLEANDFFLESGSYAKLKELSISYTFVREQLRSIGLGGFNDLKIAFIARNLFTITDYSGLDPEVSGLFGDPFQVRMDWFQYPQFRQFSTVFEFTF